MAESLSVSVKRGDAKLLRFNLGRNLTGVTAARFIIVVKVGDTPVIDRNGDIEDAAGGIVTLQLTAADYGTGKLEGGTQYKGEIKTQPGPLTHPDSESTPYFKLNVLQDLG